jgi:hypothetical protein
MLQQLLLVIPLMGFILLVLENFTVSNNTIGSASTTNSISIGSSTTAICTMRGIYNTATGAISLTGNTIQNCSVYGTGASVLYGIWNTGGSGTVDINTNKIISCSNTGTGVFGNY